jgi:hypothetical protein
MTSPQAQADDKLVKRLREKLRSEFVGSSFGDDIPDEDCQNAASRISALTSEVERLRRALENIVGQHPRWTYTDQTARAALATQEKP